MAFTGGRKAQCCFCAGGASFSCKFQLCFGVARPVPNRDKQQERRNVFLQTTHVGECLRINGFDLGREVDQGGPWAT